MRLLFRRLGADGRTEPPRDPFLGLIAALLAPTDAETTRVDCANELYRRFGNEPLLPQLERKLLLAFIDSRVLPGRLTAPEPDEDCRFLLAAAADLINGISAAIGSLTAAERQGLLPAARGFFCGSRGGFPEAGEGDRGAGPLPAVAGLPLFGGSFSAG